MVRARSFTGTLLWAGAFFVSTGLLGSACGGGGTGGSGTEGGVELTLEGSSDLFPTLDYSTGLQPPNSKVQASFSISAKGSQKVTAVVSPSGSKSAPVLTGLPGRGTLALDGGFFMIAELKVDIPKLYTYDGPIPGVENIEIPIQGEVDFDPFSIEKPVSVHADIPPSKLPGIPLPGGIPGKLIFEIAEGSTVDLTFTGSCAGSDGATATYTGRIERAGKLNLKPVIEIDAPLPFGKQSFDITTFSIDLALGGTDLAMSAPIKSFGAKPSKGDHVTGSCTVTGTGGAGTGGTGSTGTGGTGTGSGGTGTGGTGTGTGTVTGSTGSGTLCNSSADCGGLPCIGGTCSPGGGVCDTGITYGDTTVDACLSTSCCQELGVCLQGGQQQCIDCINGGGAACSAFTNCAAPCLGKVCNSGIAVNADPSVVVCLSTNCCVEFNTCSANGTDPQACADCFASGGGPGTICEDAATCATLECGI